MTVLQVRHKPKKESRVYVEENRDNRFIASPKQEKFFSFRRIKNT